MRLVLVACLLVVTVCPGSVRADTAPAPKEAPPPEAPAIVEATAPACGLADRIHWFATQPIRLVAIVMHDFNLKGLSPCLLGCAR